jgi:Rieske Fe-S protein
MTTSARELPTRRRFLCVAATLGTVTPLLSACGANVEEPSRTGTVSVGLKATDLSVGTIQILPGKGLAIARDQGGVYAMTLICTHQGCDMSQSGTIDTTARTITCSCHGAMFDANGSVLRAPASSPLAHYAVVADPAGNLSITDTIVSATTRL